MAPNDEKTARFEQNRQDVSDIAQLRFRTMAMVRSRGACSHRLPRPIGGDSAEPDLTAMND
jgi:hypothetical protein